jgi:hypothetical protein
LCRAVRAEKIENSFAWKGCILNKEEYQKEVKPQFIFTLCLSECRDAPGRIFPNQRPDWGSMHYERAAYKYLVKDCAVAERKLEKGLNATALKSRSAESSPVATGRTGAIVSHQENIDVSLDEVTGIRPKQRIVHLKHRDLHTTSPFWRLVPGTTILDTNGLPFAPGLESLDDADLFRSRILLAFERAESNGFDTPSAGRGPN